MVLAMYASALPGVVSPQRSSSLSRHSQLGHAPSQCSIRASSSRSARVIAAAADDRDAGNLSGEWPVNWSLASYEDVGQYFQDNVFKDTAAPGTLLQDIMSKDVTLTTPDTTLDELKSQFGAVSGLPVVKSKNDKTLVGVVSKKDLLKRGDCVQDIMSTPPVASRPDSKVADAACLMLKHKVHRIPVVDYNTQVVGIVTRTDIFTALALNEGHPELLTT